MTNPFFAFSFPWILVLISQQLALCKIIIPEYSAFYFVIIANLFTSLLLSLPRVKKNPQKISAFSFLERARPLILFSIFVYLFYQLAQVIYFKGFPLLWLLMGDPRVYLNFGIQSVNGLFNALYLISSTTLFLILLNKKRKFDLFLFMCLLTIPILVVSRQLLMSLFFQIACCYLIYSPKAVKKIVVGSVLLLATFIAMGNMRTGVKEITQILGPKEVVPESLYSLLWIYAYCVTPFNNINAACENVEPVGRPLYELSALLPSFLRGGLDVDAADAGFTLVHKNLTVSTFYLPLLLDFGKFYSFLFMFLFQIALFLGYRRAMNTYHPVDVIKYAVLYMVMVLSIFSNLLLFLPVIFQLVILTCFQLRFTRRSGVLVLGKFRT